MSPGRAASTVLIVSIVFVLAACGRQLSVSFDVAERPPAAPHDSETPYDTLEPASQTPPPPQAPPATPSTIPASRETAAPSRSRDIVADLAPVYFPTGRWEITGEAMAAVESIAKILLAAGDFHGTVEGHADERGSDDWNYVLGMWRAKAVKDQLRSFGVDPAKLTILSHGKKTPAAPGSDPDALARNRRVEIVVQSAR
jgi:peptidoglycan-associated lipoprotein